MSKRIDVDTVETKHKGFKGLFEASLRRFRGLMHLFTMIPVYFAACLVLGLSAAPGVFVFKQLTSFFSEGWISYFAVGFSLAVAYFCYGLTLIFLAPFTNFVLRLSLKPWRGPYYSFEAFVWFLHNALAYLPRFTFLDFITPSPLALLFYKMMGMKIGSGTVINTTYISDPSLISLGKKVTLGGSVTLVAHYGQSGLLVISPVKIGDNCTLGLKCSVMGGVTIGNNVKILPHSVVMPKTTIPDNETWGGVPAKKIESSSVPSATQAHSPSESSEGFNFKKSS